MDHDPNDLDLVASEPLEDASTGDDRDDAAPGGSPESAGKMPLYARAMRRHPLLGREKERALAVEIEERSRALWDALLSHRGTAAAAARLLGDRLPARKASEKLHAADVDHLVADELVRVVAAAARDPALAPPELRGEARTRAFARHAQAVSEAARAVSEARARFVQANIGLVFFVAGRYRETSFPLADLVQEGMFGLIKAVDRFDHRRGLRFSTYATWWIRHAVGRALSNKSRLVRLPVHMQDANQRLNAASRELRRELGREPTRDEIARAGGMSRDRLDRVKEVNSANQLRLDEPTGDTEGRPQLETFVDPSGAVGDPGESLDREVLVRDLERRLRDLTPMEQDILRRRFALGDCPREITLREIARDYGLSRERIRQIQAGALAKLRARFAADDDSDERAA